MPFVLFRKSKKQDVETIIWTIKNHEKFKRFSASIYPKLPKDIIDSIIQNDNQVKSRNLLMSYFKKNIFLKPVNYKELVSQWKKIEKDFFKKIKIITGVKPKKNYLCYLTTYGGGGSFNPPKTIWVRINPKCKKDSKYFTYTIAHEITHLLLFKKNKSQTQRKIENNIDDILIKTGLFK